MSDDPKRAIGTHETTPSDRPASAEGSSTRPEERAGGHATQGGAGDALPEIDLRERGRGNDGQPLFLESRLFMQLLVFRLSSGASSAGDVASALRRARVPAVVYEDANDPMSIGMLSWNVDPAHFVTNVRPIVADPALGLVLRPDFTMLGRTYSTGYETDLEHWLLKRPVRTVLDERHSWAVWYPLRRTGAFSKLPSREQGAILREHGIIGRAYGAKDWAHDVRLACHGLDARDNEFVIGLIGKDLHPLSHIVQTMRKTRQTSEFVSQMGPFFVGRVAFRCPEA